MKLALVLLAAACPAFAQTKWVQAPEKPLPKGVLESERHLYEIMTAEQAAMRLTKARYEELGRRLTFAEDSAWLPEQVKRSVLNAISGAFYLGMADELSWRDFFHGHIECPIGGPGERIGDAVRRANDFKYEGCNPSSANRPARDWRETPAAYSRRIFGPGGACEQAEVEAAFKDAIAAIASNPAHTILYHTRETTFHRLDPEQKNRTLRAQADSVPYQVPSVRANESDTHASLQVMFFADAGGALHVYPADPAFWPARMWHLFWGLKSPR